MAERHVRRYPLRQKIDRGVGTVVNGKSRRIETLALTFDDGPDPVWTPAILDALARCRARATFFVLGSSVRRHPDLVRRIADEGHTVGVHAEQHTRHTDMTAREGAADVATAVEAITTTGVSKPALWRTPWGVESDWTREVAADAGLRIVGWSADTHDWRGDRADAMFDSVAPLLADRAIVLAHDGLGPGALRADCSETVALVGLIAAEAQERNLALEPLA